MKNKKLAVKVLSAVFALTALLSGCAGESGTPAECITLAEYSAIQAGISYQQVQQIVGGPGTILSESGVAARCRRELFDNSDKFRVELFPIWKYFDLLRPAKQKAPSAVQRAGGMQKGGPLPAPKASARGTGLWTYYITFSGNLQICAEFQTN